jgi:hypothetical protein
MEYDFYVGDGCQVMAVFRDSGNGRRQVLMRGPSLSFRPSGVLYILRPDHTGIPAGATSSPDGFYYHFLEEDVTEGILVVEEAPCSIYHCWHVCTCKECGQSGRVWDHSQASWDDHLRYVDNEHVHTFPCAKGR